MRHGEKSFLDESLKSLGENIDWNTKRERQIRNEFLIRLDQVETKGPLLQWRKFIAPLAGFIVVFGILTLLILGEIGQQNTASHDQSTLQNNPAVSGDGGLDSFPIVTDDDSDSEIDKITGSGYELQLPQYSPMENTEIGNIVKRKSGSGIHVSATFYHQGESLYIFSQESFVSQKDAVGLPYIEEEATYSFEINGHQAYFTEDKEINRVTVHILTEAYGFTIYSDYLTEEELLQVAKSIDLSKLN